MLRALAAFAVIVSHLKTFGPEVTAHPILRHLYPIFEYGRHGVALFFVISGFCIHLRWTKQYAETGRTRVGFFDFWKRRMHRLYPPYLIMLCCSMALAIATVLYHVDLHISTVYPQTLSPARWLTLDFFTHLCMLHGLAGVFDYGGGNGAMWSLAREEYFYLMYFILLSWRRSWGAYRMLGVVLLLSLLLPRLAEMFPLWWRGQAPWFGHGVNWGMLLRYPFNAVDSALALWFQWGLGVAAVEAYYGLLKLPRWCAWWALVPAWAAVANYGDTHNYYALSALCWGMAFFTLINALLALERRYLLRDAGLYGWLAQVGLFSYSLYIVHVPLLALLSWGERALRGKMGLPPSLPYLLLVFIVFLLAAFYAGKLYFLLVERRFLNAKPALPANAPPNSA